MTGIIIYAYRHRLRYWRARADLLAVAGEKGIFKFQCIALQARQFALGDATHRTGTNFIGQLFRDPEIP